ncbi:MAG: histidine kinase [Pseudomonadales bacterium]|nr:histidine kinase [Pseudomonadales bacterium]
MTLNKMTSLGHAEKGGDLPEQDSPLKSYPRGFEPIKILISNKSKQSEHKCSSFDYKSAYERQKKATKHAEDLLENKSRELYEINQSLSEAYNHLKEYKAQLLHQEKLASIGQLAAGVAHEINNPASFVKSNLGTLKNYKASILQLLDAYDAIFKQAEISEKVKSDVSQLRKDLDIDYIQSDLNSLIDEALNGVTRIETIVKNLKTFSRPSDDVKNQFSINDCIQNTINLVWNELKYKCVLTTEFDELADIDGFEGEMSQVFLNLLVNASHAITEHGQICIKTKKLDDEVLISVEDNGSGIDDANIYHIFDPFFTTKDVDKGSGLGLSITHGIIKKHGGRILAYSELGKGTRFEIFLPTK